MGRYGKRMPISEFKAPSRKVIEELDWQQGAVILHGSEVGEFTNEQIKAHIDAWFKYVISKAQHLNEPKQKDFEKKMKTYESQAKSLFELVSNPIGGSEGHMASAISNEFKFVGFDIQPEEVLYCVNQAFEKMSASPSIEGVDYVEPFETLIIDFKGVCEADGIVYNGYNGNGEPTKLTEYIFFMHGQLPQEVQVKQLNSKEAVAARIKRVIKKEKN